MKKQTRFWLLTATTVGWMVVMSPVTPTNIIEFEFARTPEKAVTIFANWGESGMEKAKMSIVLDFVFLILYSWALSLGCKVASDFTNISGVSKIGLQLSRIIWVASACDFIENVSLLLVMQNVNATLLELAFWAAGIKFTIVIVALIFVLIVAGVGLMRKLLRSNEKKNSTLA